MNKQRRMERVDAEIRGQKGRFYRDKMTFWDGNIDK
jgi:hypothetical protein